MEKAAEAKEETGDQEEKKTKGETKDLKVLTAIVQEKPLRFETRKELAAHVMKFDAAVKEFEARHSEDEEGSVFMVSYTEGIKARDEEQRKHEKRMAAKKKPLVVILGTAASEKLVNADTGPKLGSITMTASQAFRTAKKEAILQVEGSVILRAKWRGKKLAFKCRMAKDLPTSVFSLSTLLSEGFDMRTANN